MDSQLKEALKYYEIDKTEETFIRHNENKTFKIKESLSGNKYVVRIHKPCDGFSTDFFGKNLDMSKLLKGEMSLISYINKNTAIAMQRPLPNKDGEFVSILSDGTPVTILSWIEGDTLDNIELNKDVLTSIGKMTGQLHQATKAFASENQICRYSYDEKLLDRIHTKIESGAKKDLIHKQNFKIIVKAIDEIKYRIDKLNKIKGTRGIVHTDLSKTNMILSHGEIVPIDFSLSGNSHYYMDLGSLFGHFTDIEQRKSIINGYISITKEDIETEYIEPFYVFQSLSFIASHLEGVAREEWFKGILDKWCEENYRPLSRREKFLFL
ncbi:phosphotransferase [Clostridiaceae bacterium M8S5]|nr:phosphotransferase [Clostridiaceae bacterium M8S5]